MTKYTIELTLDEIRMIRSALELEAERRMAYNISKANAFYDLYKTFEQRIIASKCE